MRRFGPACDEMVTTPNVSRRRFPPTTISYLSIANVASGRYIGFMRSVGLKVLKNKLSEYVRLVANGETVLVTDRDRVVAELVPPRPGRSPLLADAQLASAVREGWLAPPAYVNHEPPPRLPVAPLSVLLDELAYDRGDR